ncbi:MAG TPA: hypothetical protein VGS59_08655 [Candidatus Acidoferrales bacterium]|nr:hypothetical protein [Candidatus Acidoferrales bacterium]
MKFAKIVFWIAGWGVLILTPLYFMFDRIGRQAPPAIAHPQYYGFVGVAFSAADRPIGARTAGKAKSHRMDSRRAGYDSPGPISHCAGKNKAAREHADA